MNLRGEFRHGTQTIIDTGDRVSTPGERFDGHTGSAATSPSSAMNPDDGGHPSFYVCGIQIEPKSVAVDCRELNGLDDVRVRG